MMFLQLPDISIPKDGLPYHCHVYLQLQKSLAYHFIQLLIPHQNRSAIGCLQFLLYTKRACIVCMHFHIDEESQIIKYLESQPLKGYCTLQKSSRK